MRRATGITSAKAGRSPKPAKWASIGTPARRIASRPLRPTVTTARSPLYSVISRAANLIVLVQSGPASPRSVVIRTSRRLPPSRSASKGWSSRLSTAAMSARTSSSLSEYGPADSVAYWARFSLDAATNCIARVICLMLRTAPMRLRISRRLATTDHARRRIRSSIDDSGEEGLAEGVDGAVEFLRQLVGHGLLLAELLEDVRVLGLEESVQLALELLHPRCRHVVELALRRDIEDHDLLLDRQRLVLRLLDDLRQLLAARQLVARGLVEV